MNEQWYNQFLEAVAPALDSRTEPCSHHEDWGADAICPKCEKLFCWACMAFDEREEVLLCRSCYDARPPARRLGSRLVRMSSFYVLLLVSITLTAYAFGLGNPRLKDHIETDAAQGWHHRRAPLSWLQQAGRARERADFLRQRGALQEEVIHWERIAHPAFVKARMAWRGEKPEIDLAIAEALSLARQGYSKSGHQALQELGARIPVDHPSQPAYLYHRGWTAWQAGFRDLAVSDWTTVLEVTDTVEGALHMESVLIELSDLLSGPLAEERLYLLVRQTCETLLSDYEIRNLIFEVVREYHIEGAFPEGVIPPSALIEPAKPEPGDVEPPWIGLIDKD